MKQRYQSIHIIWEHKCSKNAKRNKNKADIKHNKRTNINTAGIWVFYRLSGVDCTDVTGVQSIAPLKTESHHNANFVVTGGTI